MRVTSDKYGRFRKFGGERHDIVGKIIAAGARFQSHVAGQHNRIRAVAFRFRNRAAHQLDRILEVKTTSELRAKPKRHSGRSHSNDRDLNPRDFFQDVRLYFREWMSRITKIAGGYSIHRDVRGHYRHCRSCQRVQKCLHAPIKLMISHDPGVVFEMIEQIDHQLAFGAQRNVGALINVADVDQNRVAILPPPTPDLGNASRQPAEIRCAVVIHRWQDVSVQIGGVQNRNRDRVGAWRSHGPNDRRRGAEKSGLTDRFKKRSPAGGTHLHRRIRISARKQFYFDSNAT